MADQKGGSNTTSLAQMRMVLIKGVSCDQFPISIYSTCTLPAISIQNYRLKEIWTSPTVKQISGGVERKVEAFGENTIVHYCNCSMHDHAIHRIVLKWLLVRLYWQLSQMYLHCKIFTNIGNFNYFTKLFSWMIHVGNIKVCHSNTFAKINLATKRNSHNLWN